MSDSKISRRGFLSKSGTIAAGGAVAGGISSGCASASTGGSGSAKRGGQRLSLRRLRKWEKLGYGMFVHYGMSTFVGEELPDGAAPPSVYAPERLDVDQWVSVARDAGMKYMVLTAKHVAGHCLWPSKHTDYSVANSTDRTDVLEKFVTACEKRGVLPGFYYCSWDNHHLFGSRTPSMAKWQADMYTYPKELDPRDNEIMPAYTSSMYQTFQSAQVSELLTTYGPFGEVWIDIPGVLGRGYRTYHYKEIAERNPDGLIMMNSGIGDGADYNVDYAWPSDLIAIERRLPPGAGHQKWREIEGENYYIPGEVCDPIGKNWFHVDGDLPRSDAELIGQFERSQERGVNLLLNVPPDRTGTIPGYHVEALMRLRKNANL